MSDDSLPNAEAAEVFRTSEVRATRYDIEECHPSFSSTIGPLKEVASTAAPNRLLLTRGGVNDRSGKLQLANCVQRETPTRHSLCRDVSKFNAVKQMVQEILVVWQSEGKIERTTSREMLDRWSSVSRCRAVDSEVDLLGASCAEYS